MNITVATYANTLVGFDRVKAEPTTLPAWLRAQGIAPRAHLGGGIKLALICMGDYVHAGPDGQVQLLRKEKT